jgi:hypothetical protein
MMKIPLERLAAKFAAARNGQAPNDRQHLADPRARELLLWIQSQSVQDGGWEAFTDNLCSHCAGLIGTPTMRSLAGKSTYTAKEKKAIMDELPRHSEWHGTIESRHTDQWLYRNFWTHAEDGVHDGDHYRLQPNDDYINSLDRTAFQALCAKFIKEFLPGVLHQVCTERDAWFPEVWYCENLFDALLRTMDAARAQIARALAQTTVAKVVFDALEFAIHTRCMIRIDGSSRYGKTESIRAFAAMHPGRCRLVTADCMNTDKDFFGAIADALGIERDYRTTAHHLRLKIDYIARHCGLCFIIDEAHHLFPSAPNRHTPTTRIEWVRTHLVDVGCPVVIVTTPQVYDSAARRFKQATSYNFDQFDGRLRKTFKLVEKMTSQDVLKVVRVKAPLLAPDWQEEIAEAARTGAGSYLAVIQSIIDTANWLARQAGRALPNDTELERAIAESAPNAAATAEASLDPAPQKQPLAVRHRPARSVRPAVALPAPARAVTPATSITEPQPV